MSKKRTVRGVVVLLVVLWVAPLLADADAAFRVSATHLGAFFEKKPWSLEVNSSGRLTVDIAPSPYKRKLPRRAVQDLIRTFQQEQFLALRDEYGTPLVDTPVRVIDVALDGRQKRVSLHSNLDADPNRDEVKRALRVWIAIRDLFDLPQALDSRTEDRAFLEGTTKPKSSE